MQKRLTRVTVEELEGGIIRSARTESASMAMDAVILCVQNQEWLAASAIIDCVRGRLCEFKTQADFASKRGMLMKWIGVARELEAEVVVPQLKEDIDKTIALIAEMETSDYWLQFD